MAGYVFKIVIGETATIPQFQHEMAVELQQAISSAWTEAFEEPPAYVICEWEESQSRLDYIEPEVMTDGSEK